MKKAFLFVFFFSLFGTKAEAQTDIPDVRNVKRPYLIINGKHADALSFLLLNYQKIENIRALPPEQAKKYGSEAIQNGAVEIIMTKDAKLASIPELLTMFHIRPEALMLHKWVWYSSHPPLLLENPETFVASPEMVFMIKLKRTAAGTRQLIISRDSYFSVPALSVESSVARPFKELIDSLNSIFIEESKKYEIPEEDIIICGCVDTTPSED